MSARPNFFIVGAPKCGTTSLYAQLQSHPQIFMPAVKEPAFLADDMYQPKPGTTSLEQYLGYFAPARPGQLVGEASTNYLFSRVAALRIREFAPDARIVAMIRDPVELMHSFHAQLVYQGVETLEDFEAALAAEDERRPRTGFGEGPRLPQILLYREVARLAEQVERYFDVFGRERVHVIVLDDYRRDPARVYQAVLEYLGVSPDFEPSFTVVNQYKGVRSGRLHRFLVQPPRPLQRLVHAVPAGPRYALLGKVKQLNSVPQPRPPMDAELRRRLRVEFASEVDRLGRLLGRDLSEWSAGEEAENCPV